MPTQQAHWRASAPHLYLLTKFLKPQPSDYPCSEHWAKEWSHVLGEPVTRAIQRFVTDGALAPASTSEALDGMFRVVDLQNMLRERSLRVSGAKNDLIARLIEADHSAMDRMVENGHIISCTLDGRKSAEEYLRQQKADRSTAEKRALDALSRHDFHQAAQLVAEFEALQVFQRGIGIDWSRYDPAPDAYRLRIIYSAHPGILRALSSRDLDSLRPAAAWMMLWGVSRAPRSLLPKALPGLSFDVDTAARMLLFYSRHKVHLEELRETGWVKGVTIAGSYDGCEHCKSLRGKYYVWGRVPELPHPGCDHPMGCRCMYMSSA